MLYVSNKKYQLSFRVITSNLPYTDVVKKRKLQFTVSSFKKLIIVNHEECSKNKLGLKFPS